MNGRITQDLFVYSAQLAALNAGATLTVNVSVEADSDFEWLKSAFFATNDGTGAATGATNVLPLVEVQIQDSGSGRNLFSEAVNVQNIAGDGKLPFVNPLPRMFRANSNISFTFSNISSGTNLVLLDFCMIGRKVWK